MKKITNKLTLKLAVSAALVMGSIGSTAMAAIVVVDGVSYRVESSAGIIYDSISSILQAAPYWGNEALARSFAIATAGSAGDDNNYGPPPGAGPAFAWGLRTTNSGNNVVDSYVWAIGLNDEYSVPWLRDQSIYWAIVSLLGPSSTDTRNSFRSNAFALRNVYNQQSAKMAQGLGYDCTTFDAKGVCVSFAGSRSDTKGQFDAAISNTLIAAYQPSKNIRFGGYVDQSYGNSTSGGLTINKGNPGFGLFGAWTQNTDGSGVQVRAAANMGKIDIETQREAIGTAEAGYGESDVKSNGFSIEVSKNYALNSTFSARPYIGYRQTTNTRSAYTEQSSDDVTAPLTYAKLKQKTETVFAGVTLGAALSEQTSLMLSAGVEDDQSNRIDGYAASSIDIAGIEAIDMSTNKRKSRPTVALALSHNMGKAQNIAVSVTHRKEAFDDASTTAAMVQYSKGF